MRADRAQQLWRGDAAGAARRLAGDLAGAFRADSARSRMSLNKLTPVVEAVLPRPRFDSVSTFRPAQLLLGRAFFVLS